MLSTAAGNRSSASAGSHSIAVPKVFTNQAALHASMAAVQGGTDVSSSISFNFNATAIPAGDVIWFTSVLKLNGTVPKAPVSVSVQNSSIQFTAGTTSYTLNPPNAVVTFSPTVTTSTATFDTADNPQPVWLQSQLNPQPSGNTLLQAFAFTVPPGGLPGAIKNVTWTNNFASDTANLSLNWQWAASVYTGCVSTAYSSDDAKPTDDNSASIYKNSDHAGTPEACKSFVTAGATGGGASNYTGSLSGTASLTPPALSANPVIQASINPPPNTNGWNNSNVTVTFSCSDANFAITACPAPVTLTSEGAGQIVSGTVVDAAGGSATAKTSVTVNLDKTSPSIIASATSASGSGSNVLTLPVTVSFTCSDTGSGVASCPAPIQVTTAGADQSFTGTATDKAGNTATTSISLNTENAPLAVTTSLSPLPVNGWNNTSVTISYQCTGGSPPVQCPQPATISAEGAGQAVLATATDAAGQSSTVSTSLNIDKTAPTIIATPTPLPNNAGWNTTDVTVAYSCSDALSGMVSCPAQQVVSTEGKAQQITASVSDTAGNTNSTTTTLNIEKTAPTITAAATPAPNAAGWNNSDVTVNFTCVASVSDITSCPVAIAVTTEGSAQEISGTVTDQAGKSNTATLNVSLDKTPPAIAISAPISVTENRPSITVTYSDSGSGIDVSSFTLFIDGVDHTSEFAATATSATGTIANPLPSGSHVITATIADVAGNKNSATAPVNIQATPVTISITQPTSGIFTNANSITVSGSVTGITPIAVVAGGVAASVSGGSFSIDVPLGAGPSQNINVSATDALGSTASASVTVSIDRVPPTIIGSISPSPNAAGWNNTDVTVSFLCSDDSSGIASCSGAVPLGTEGAHQVVTGTAIDKAGNTTSASVTVNIDKTPPIITATQAPPPVNGWNNSNVTVTFACTDNLSGVANCPQTTSIVTEGQNQTVPGQATDVAGNVAQAAITVSIDKTPPTIVQLSTPDHISQLHGGQVSVTATDNFTVAQVVISVNGTPLGTFTTAPYQADLEVPAGASPGDTLTVTTVVTDQAGNTQTASRGVSVTADGVVVGQVLSDATGLPQQGATVQLISATGQSVQTDAKGRYSFQASDAHLFVSATNAGSSTVEREIFVQPGAGTVAVDARLTPLAAGVSVGSAGGKLAAGAISITVPAALVLDGTTFQLTPLSGQGLPGLLPLGWSPVAAFDLRSNASFSGLPGVVSPLPSLVAHLVTYDSGLHAWVMVASNLQSVNGACSFTVPGSGAYALVVPDTINPPIPIPDPGSPLTGVAVQALDPAASSSGSLNPAMLPPAGGTAVATLGLQSPSFAPSGTVVQANLSETFTLASGDLVSEETRSEDILLYNALAPANSSMGAVFPVTPSHTYTLTQLVTGKVHLDILAGREGIRGQPGGNDPVTVSDGIATLSVPGGALSQDTAISVAGTSLENFVPTSSTMAAIQEVLVDLSGEILNTPAQLSISATGLNPGDTFLLTQVQRINGVPHIVTVARAQINGTALSSVASPGLPGVTQGGEYVFYDIAAPAGFVQGITSSTAGPVPALVLSDSLQIAAISGGSGQYIIPVLAGTANLKASAPNTSLAGTATVQVVAGQTVAANILLAGTVTTATVTPADGTLGVPTSTIFTVSTSAPISPASIQASNISLFQGPASAPGAPVPLQSPILSTSGTTLTVAPVSNLAPATQYTIQVAGLADVSGGAIAVPTSSITTKASAPVNFDPNAITFAFPDQNGNIHVSAPAGSLPPGTKVLIIDQSNAVVLSLTVLNDGSLSGDFPGTINDVLQVSVTDPNGATASFTRSQFVAPDGSIAVGPGGGTVTGPGGIAMIIPAGALTQGAVFSLQPLGQDAFPQLPSFAGATFGSGMQITAPSMPFFSQEVKLAFPKPANVPDGAFYYVYRQLTDQNNNVYFETIDHAFVQGTGSSAQVVTASPPFCGYRNPYGNFQAAATASFSPLATAIVKTYFMWAFDPNQPGVSSQGLIVGRVLQANPLGPGQTEPTFHTVTGASVQLADGSGNVATTNASCGEFTIFDPHVGGGSRQLTATSPDGKTKVNAVANEVNGIQVDDATYDVTAGLELLYRNVGRVTITLPPPTVVQPPQIDVRMFTLTNLDFRVAASSIVQSGTPLVIAFKSQLTVTGASINGHPLNIQPDYVDNALDFLSKLDFRATDSSSSDPLHDYIAGSPGAYTLTVTALSPQGDLVSVDRGFLVVAPGGSNNVVTPQTAPLVITATPLDNTTGVPQSVFPQIVFSEPVTNVPANVSLVDANGQSAPVSLLGIKTDGTPADPVGPSDFITSLTIRPVDGLKFNMLYTLALKGGIVDQNSPPLALTPFTLHFTTFGPAELDQNQPAIGGLTRLVPIKQRAYAGKFASTTLGGVDVFNIVNPTSPAEEGITNEFVGRAVDIAGLKSSPVDRCLTEVTPGTPCPVHGANGPLIAVATTQLEFPMPSNIYIYDVSTQDQPARVGALSATTSSVNDGTLLRIVMKDQFIFASTLNKGLQMIDLQQAINEFQQTDPVSFGQGLTVDGTGFALDAVVNTIPVPINVPAGTSTVLAQAVMWDLKAGDFATSTAGSPAFPPPPVGSPHTLIVATGRLPFVVADPQLGGIQAVLYPAPDTLGTGLSQGPLASPDGQFQMQAGRAVAVGSVPAVDANNNPIQEPVAVVVGTGTATSNGVTTPGVPLLAVVNMTDGRLPFVQGMVELIDNGQLILPIDVILDGSIALISTGTKVVLVDITDPGNPIVSGDISGNFGNHLALTDDGILITSDFSNVGVHTATFRPMVSIPAVAPLLSTELLKGNQALLNTLVKLNLAPRLVSAKPVAGTLATAQLMDGAVQIGPTQTFQFATDGTGQVSFDKGLQIPLSQVSDTSKTLSVQITAATDQGTITGSVPLAAGRIDPVADLNNDTVIDDSDVKLKPVQDADPQHQGNPDMFAFWEASNIPNMHGNIASLVDFATLRLRIGAWPTPDQGKIHLHMTGAGAGDWQLVFKRGSKFKDYLANATTASTQLADVKTPQTGCQSQVAPTTSGGTPTPTLNQGSCLSDSNGEIELPASLQTGDFDFLFSCNKCPQVTAGNPPRTIEVKALFADSSSQVLDHVNVDIRPVAGWVGLYTVRQAPGQQGYGTDPDTPYFAARPHQDVFPNGNQYQAAPSAANITVFVHGYNVSDQDSENYWTPMMMKRLYWAGHPVLSAQVDSQGHPSFFAGFEWPGDVNPALDLKATAFPIDEFRALQTGVPLAKWLNSLKVDSQANTINVIAHSLGNLAVNSALSRYTNNPNEIAAGTVDKYIMNEAAMPADSFGALTDYADLPALKAPHLAQLGAPADARWISEWSNKTPSDQTNWNCTAQSLAFGYNPANPAVCPITNSILAPPSVPPIYFLRWSQQRPNNGMVPPDTDPITTAPRRGSWTNFFAGNLPGQGAATQVYNTFNTGDNILGVWSFAQLSRKPFRSAAVAASDLDFAHPLVFPNPSDPFPIGRTHEGGQCAPLCWPALAHLQETISIDPLFWAELPGTDPDQAKLFNAPNQLQPADHWNITRQWAELAFWFPAQSGPVGIGSLPSVPFTGEYDFTIPGQAGILVDVASELAGLLGDPSSGAASHSFAQIKPLSDVWCVFKTWRQIMDPNNPDPDPLDPSIAQNCRKIR